MGVSESCEESRESINLSEDRDLSLELFTGFEHRTLILSTSNPRTVAQRVVGHKHTRKTNNWLIEGVRIQCKSG